MNPKDLLRASLLDILFEHRNKDYGAYALRKEYNQRMLIALSIGLFLVLVFIVFSLFKTGRDYSQGSVITGNEVIMKTIEFQPIDPPEAEIKPPPRVATIHDATIRIVDDHLATDVPTEDDNDGRQTATATIDGDFYNQTSQPVYQSTNQPVSQPIDDIPERELSQRDAAFPGGQSALQRFLSDNLVTPDDLEAGELKRVEVRFTVDKAGKVSGFEIITSGGSEFDREVIRVCRRMPKWMPAMQNGIEVPVNYILPVTFIGVEQ